MVLPAPGGPPPLKGTHPDRPPAPPLHRAPRGACSITSALLTTPPRPVPRTAARSIPSSAATRFAAGDARTSLETSAGAAPARAGAVGGADVAAPLLALAPCVAAVVPAF